MVKELIEGLVRLGTELSPLAEADVGVVLVGRCDHPLGIPYLSLRGAVGRHLPD